MRNCVCNERRILPWLITGFFILMCLLWPCSFVVAEQAPNGVDLWEVDGLHFPDYGASNNLALNPSFEAGFRYWGFLCYAGNAIPLTYSNFQIIDANVAYSGTHSLRLLAALQDPLSIGTFPIPVTPNTNYKLSFWAKSSSSYAKLNVWGRQQSGILSTVTFSPTSTWQRFTMSVTPQDEFISILFDGRQWGGPLTNHYVWVDDVQFEPGTTATSFTQTPVTAKLVSSARGNFLPYGQDPNFKLEVNSGYASTAHSVSISVEDFFFKNVYTHTYNFTTDSTGKSTITLSDLDTAVSGLRGVFIATGVVNITGVSRAYTDYFRFSVMNFLDNTHRNKDLFNLTFVYQNQYCGPQFERFLQRTRDIGFGSITYDFQKFANDLDPNRDSERMELLEDYGISCMGRPVVKLHDGDNGEISECGGAYIMTDIRDQIDPNSTTLNNFSNICAIKAQIRDWNNIWWFTGESNPGIVTLDPQHPTAFAKFLIATNNGIKAGNPNAKVLIEGGPWKLDAQSTGWVQNYIQNTRAIDPSVTFDGAAAHHYRPAPEYNASFDCNANLDSDVARFIDMLDDNGCGSWPFYINEGGNYCPYNIPAANVTPYAENGSNNSWYMGPLSYHCGWAERICPAFSARNWLVALKYQDRVACMSDFMTPSRYVDFDFTPRFYEKIPNTLGRILGNASFVRDIPIAPYCRAYLFREDSTNAPIAVIWGYKPAVDRWQESAPEYTFDFGSQSVTFIDLMENEVDFPTDAAGRLIIPMSPFPLFIKGAAGTDNQLCNAISAYGYEVHVTMDANNHNGNLNSQTKPGFWYNTPTAIATGWTETAQYVYTTTLGWLSLGSSAQAVNNTGEQVRTNEYYTVQADLGGVDGSTATVNVYATQYANGTGTKVLLAQVSRAGHTSDGYSLFTVSNTGTAASSSLAGYYVQVVLNTYGYYDNIVVTSTASKVIMDATHHNGNLTSQTKPGYWYNTPTARATEWTETVQYVYTTTVGWMLLGTYAQAVNNTGELVEANQRYMVRADLGGVDGLTATVNVYATQNADGTGTKVLLSQVSRAGHTSDGYSLFTVSSTGTAASSSLAGYYVQVVLNAYGYYDNIVVTSMH